MSDLYRKLPAVDALLSEPRLGELPHSVAVAAIRDTLEQVRREISEGQLQSLPDLADRVLDRARLLVEGRLRPVLNATGVVVHTNLGRAPWSAQAVHAAARAAGYCNLELDLETGSRGGRLAAISALLQHLTGCERALVVNNCAAAVLLAVTALARDREVIVSRGELIEIGGSFRVPEVISSGGARLVEVGTTNRTRLADYERAITVDTAVLLRAHPSNFKVVGFTEAASIEDLVGLAQARGLHVVDDQGAGSMDGERGAPSVRRAVAAGADVVLFSGDKLLGGPQAGYAVGSEEAIATLRRHPLYRALRVDKTILAACEATLLARVRGDRLPVDDLIGEPADQVEARAQELAGLLEVRGTTAEVEAATAWVGGGSLPGEQVPSFVVSVAAPRLHEVARRLRVGNPSLVARVSDERLRLDLRTLHGVALDQVADAVAEAIQDD